MEKDILSASELRTNTNTSEMIKVLNGFINERGLKCKNCFAVCTDGAASLKVEVQV
jgi:Pyruvate/2-oxoacid:ferredoxin oxidoreductase delta subunit